MMEFKYDTQLLIEGKGLDEDAINDYFTENKNTFSYKRAVEGA